MRKIIISPSALNDLELFKSGNQKLVFRIFEIIADVQSDPFSGGIHYQAGMHEKPQILIITSHTNTYIRF
jgi:Txe/YoeB family toxin of Txe-Axe toxin-antitoxin module